MKRGKGEDGDENDNDLWKYVTRGVKVYKPSSRQVPVMKPKSREVSSVRVVSEASVPCHIPAVPQGRGFDRATETRFRRGQLPLEGRLDLHGLTQAEAFNALHRFIKAAVVQEKRTVLVITGKGQRFEGVLRRMVPQWLEDPVLAQYLIAIAPAQPKDGGTGAFYLRLRKPRE